MNLLLSTMALAGSMFIDSYDYWECVTYVDDQSYGGYSATYEEAVDLTILNCTNANQSDADCRAGLQCTHIQK